MPTDRLSVCSTPSYPQIMIKHTVYGGKKNGVGCFPTDFPGAEKALNQQYQRFEINEKEREKNMFFVLATHTHTVAQIKDFRRRQHVAAKFLIPSIVSVALFLRW